MPLETKDVKENTGLSQEYCESLYDSQMSGAEGIKISVINLVAMAANKPSTRPSDSLALFNTVVEIADSLDSMRVSFEELYDAYCEMTAE